MKASTAFAIGILALMVGVICFLATYPFQASLFPYLVCLPVTVLLVIQVIREFREKSLPQATSTSEAGVERCQLIAETGWLLAFLPLLYLMGFSVTIPVYTFLYLKFHHRSWSLAIILSLLLGVAIYTFFVIGLKMPLYEGILMRWLVKIVRGW